MLSCNGGHLYSYDKKGENVASVLSTRIVSGKVIAYDGNVGFGKTYISRFGLGGYSARLSNTQDSYYNLLDTLEIENPRDPTGKVYYQNGNHIFLP